MKVADWKIGDKYWKASHKAYYCTVVQPDGTRQDRKLGTGEDEAEEVRAEIITSVRRKGVPSSDYGVNDLCNLFLGYTQANNTMKTYKCYRSFLRSFTSTIPASLRVRDLKLHHIQNWLTRKYPATGNTNTRHNAVATVRRVFNWATNDMEYLDRNPLLKLKRPPKVSRGNCLSKAQWAEVLSHYGADDPFRIYLEFLLATGCRPQEARIVEARHVKWGEQEVHFKDGEVPGKKGDRDILLIDAALASLRKQALKYPKGPLFRNEDGNPWTADALCCRFAHLKGKLTFNAHCYLARHSVATEMLDADASAGAVAAVLGHKDATMVLRVYGKHIDKRKEHLRECLERAM